MGTFKSGTSIESTLQSIIVRLVKAIPREKLNDPIVKIRIEHIIKNHLWRRTGVLLNNMNFEL